MMHLRLQGDSSDMDYGMRSSKRSFKTVDRNAHNLQYYRTAEMEQATSYLKPNATKNRKPSKWTNLVPYLAGAICSM